MIYTSIIVSNGFSQTQSHILQFILVHFSTLKYATAVITQEHLLSIDKYMQARCTLYINVDVIAFLVAYTLL